ncbi:threonine synthase [candidate division KSB1 bacterium]|nr:threonine synthase [candidate division KSB1 bacterium]
MKLYSTRDHSITVSFHDALFQGQAADRGLYMPQLFPLIGQDEFKNLAGLDFKELAYTIAQKYLADEISSTGLENIIQQAYHFAPALKQLDDFTFVLELFHGPTLSFKDFGAQFMARAMSYFVQDEHREITILVATSGDTGSAVAHAYHKVEGIRIILLYPSGKVSPLQEKQFTTLGNNILALEIDGTFDDCQSLVKQAFADDNLRKKVKLTSANSINIGRLVPQSFYYFWSVINVFFQLHKDILVCVPSGNFGNLTAGLFGHAMGLPVKKFIAAVNSNNVIPEYFETGEYKPRPSVRTLSNAMDVGNPSNWERIRDLYNNNYNSIKQHIWTTSVNDPVTIETMKQVYEKYHYIIDPHTAVGMRAVERYRDNVPADKFTPAIVLSTAHPGKFQEIVNDALNMDYKLPESLHNVLRKEKQTIKMPGSFKYFRDFLWAI